MRAFGQRGAGGNSGLDHQGGLQPRTSGKTGMKRLGMAAELQLQSSRGTARQGERHGRLRTVKADQARSPRGGTDRADGRGGVPARQIVVVAAQGATAADDGVVAREIGRQQRTQENLAQVR